MMLAPSSRRSRRSAPASGPRCSCSTRPTCSTSEERHERANATPTRCLVSGAHGRGPRRAARAHRRELLRTLRPVELLLPYSRGRAPRRAARAGRRARARRDTPEGVRVDALLPDAPRGALRALRRRVLRRRTRLSAVVAAARENASALARAQLLEVVRGDRRRARARARLASCGDVPRHVAELLGERLAALVA